MTCVVQKKKEKKREIWSNGIEKYAIFEDGHEYSPQGVHVRCLVSRSLPPKRKSENPERKMTRNVETRAGNKGWDVYEDREPLHIVHCQPGLGMLVTYYGRKKEGRGGRGGKGRMKETIERIDRRDCRKRMEGKYRPKRR